MNKRNAAYRILAVLLVFCLCASPTWGCFVVIVGKKVSIDGSILIGHAEQNGGPRYLNFRRVPRFKYQAGDTITLRGGAKIPQVAETYSFLWTQNPGAVWGDSYLNEWGVSIVTNACSTRGVNLDELRADGQLVENGASYLLRRLVAERAKTSREAVQIAGKIIEQVGYPAGRTMTIGDPNEVWMLSMARGNNWVAKRAPEDEVVLLPNIYIIGEVDLTDTENYMSSPGLIENAIKKGWYDPDSGEPFRFCEAYAAPRRTLVDPRQWRSQSAVTGQTIPRFPDRQLPFSVKPAHKMSITDVAGILRIHNNQGRGGGGICAASLQEGAVFQLRTGMPVDIGCVYWRTTAEPCTGGLVPWYAGITATPQQFFQPYPVEKCLTLDYHFSLEPETAIPHADHAWNTFKALQDFVNKDRAKYATPVRAAWDAFEARLFANQKTVEAEALALWGQDQDQAKKHLTDYSQKVALEALDSARQLLESLGKEAPNK